MKIMQAALIAAFAGAMGMTQAQGAGLTDLGTGLTQDQINQLSADGVQVTTGADGHVYANTAQLNAHTEGSGYGTAAGAQSSAAAAAAGSTAVIVAVGVGVFAVIGAVVAGSSTNGSSTATSTSTSTH